MLFIHYAFVVDNKLHDSPSVLTRISLSLEIAIQWNELLNLASSAMWSHYTDWNTLADIIKKMYSSNLFYFHSSCLQCCMKFLLDYDKFSSVLFKSYYTKRDSYYFVAFTQRKIKTWRLIPWLFSKLCLSNQ